MYADVSIFDDVNRNEGLLITFFVFLFNSEAWAYRIRTNMRTSGTFTIAARQLDVVASGFNCKVDCDYTCQNAFPDGQDMTRQSDLEREFNPNAQTLDVCGVFNPEPWMPQIEYCETEDTVFDDPVDVPTNSKCCKETCTPVTWTQRGVKGAMRHVSSFLDLLFLDQLDEICV